ncbi:MAG: DNRLRE domain-containing protein [Clostridiaceae bacterium]|nr:DNRLRE domain-containing protein [Clostridiaceae bacterium]
MSVIDLNAQSSFNYFTCHFYREPQRGYLQLGCEKTIYLCFDLPLWIQNTLVQEARLILYKLPCHTFCAGEAADIKTCGMFTIYPLAEVFNAYGCLACPPVVDTGRSVEFIDTPKSYTEVDITHIVQAWNAGAIDNNGILIMGRECSSVIFYASDQNCISEIRPILRLTLKNFCPTSSLQSVDCEAKVTSP